MFPVELTVSQVTVEIPYLILLGFGVGLLSGLLGVGGGWLVAPALNILGFPMTFAVGTGMTQMTATSFVSTFRHRKYGHTDFALGLGLGLPMIFGVKGGKEILLALEAQGLAGDVTRLLYVVLLFLISFFMLREFFPMGKSLKRFSFGVGEWLHGLKLRPTINFTVSGIRAPWVLLLGLALMTGLLSGIMGVGGGFLLFPAMTLLLKVPTRVAVATSTVCVFVSGTGGTTLYALAGRVDWTAFSYLFAGAFFGSILGALASNIVEARGLRFLFALLVCFAAISMVCQQLGFSIAAMLLLFGSTSLVCLYALFLSLKGLFGGRSAGYS